MKRITFIFAALFCSTLCFAQLKVYQNGNVGIGSTLTTAESHLNIGNRTYSDSTYNVGLTSSSLLAKQYNIGVDGWAHSNSAANSRIAMGVRGIAGNGTAGYNYGVAGILKGTRNGAAVFGAVENENGICLNGQYAGYFRGDVKSTGVAKMKLVNTFEDYDSFSSTLEPLAFPFEIISMMTPVKRLIRLQDGGTVRDNEMGDDNTPDNYGNENSEEDGTRLFHFVTHYDIIANNTLAQSNLMLTDTSGHHYLNYTEIIPLLVAAVHNLDERVNTIEDPLALANSYLMENGGTDDISAPRLAAHNMNDCILYQNNPNPFTENTVIKYSVPEDAGDAWLYVFDMQGAMLKQLRLDTKTDRIILLGGDLKPGMYLYSLIVNGREIDTKRMILSK